MDSMVRKMGVHQQAFTSAIEDGDEVQARNHLSEIIKFANYLDNDLTDIVTKSENTIDLSGVSHFAGGVPLAKFNESGSKFDASQRSDVLKGFMPPARTNQQMRKNSGTFGRRV
jgi:hypothetical protein|tara:strand:- start:111 stop:452 length:342 start_codon:yes stop_codon:yes gene_type:complete